MREMGNTGSKTQNTQDHKTGEVELAIRHRRQTIKIKQNHWLTYIMNMIILLLYSLRCGRTGLKHTH